VALQTRRTVPVHRRLCLDLYHSWNSEHGGLISESTTTEKSWYLRNCNSTDYNTRYYYY